MARFNNNWKKRGEKGRREGGRKKKAQGRGQMR
jgi:hypothetical protein